MARYLVEFSYTKEAVAALVAKPEDRAVAVGELIGALGGRLIDFYFTFGDYDGVLIAELPDNATTLAVDLASIVPGDVSKLKTTVLLTSQEVAEALGKAEEVSLRPPGA